MFAERNFYQSNLNVETGRRVESELNSRDPSRFHGIKVRAFYGIVELTGVVTKKEYKRQAMQFAYDVAGVSTVVESLEVIPVDCVPQPQFLRHSRSVAIGSNPAGHAL